MGTTEALLERYKAVIESGDMTALGELIMEESTDDFVEEWPQSGERIVGRETAVKLGESYAGATGTSPRLSFRRLTGGGDVWVAEGTIDYGDGIPVSYVSIIELRGGKVAKVTEYFANPFEAPAWRAGFVERMEPVGV